MTLNQTAPHRKDPPPPGTFREETNLNHEQPDMTDPSDIPDMISQVEDRITASQETAVMDNRPSVDDPRTSPTLPAAPPEPRKKPRKKKESHKKMLPEEKALRAAARETVKKEKRTKEEKKVDPLLEPISIKEAPVNTMAQVIAPPPTVEAPASVAAPGDLAVTEVGMSRFEREVHRLYVATVSYIERTNMMRVFRIASNEGGFVRFTRMPRETVAMFETEYLGTPEEPGLIYDWERLHEEVIRLCTHTNTALRPDRMARTFSLICGFQAWTTLPLPAQSEG